MGVPKLTPGGWEVVGVQWAEGSSGAEGMCLCWRGLLGRTQWNCGSPERTEKA